MNVDENLAVTIGGGFFVVAIIGYALKARESAYDITWKIQLLLSNSCFLLITTYYASGDV